MGGDQGDQIRDVEFKVCFIRGLLFSLALFLSLCNYRLCINMQRRVEELRRYRDAKMSSKSSSAIAIERRCWGFRCESPQEIYNTGEGKGPREHRCGVPPFYKAAWAACIATVEKYCTSTSGSVTISCRVGMI